MPIHTPIEFMSMPEQEVFDAPHVKQHQNWRKSARKAGAQLPSGLAVSGTCQYISDLTGIHLTEDDLQCMFAMYPAERARLARYTPSDLVKARAVKQGEGERDSYLIANVVADFFGRTVWPCRETVIDRPSFALRLRKVAHKMGYNVIHPAAV